MNWRLLLLLLFSAAAHAWVLEHWPDFSADEQARPGPMAIRLSGGSAASVSVPELETGKGQATTVRALEPSLQTRKNENQSGIASIAPAKVWSPWAEPEPRVNRETKKNPVSGSSDEHSHALPNPKTGIRQTEVRPRPESKFEKELADNAKAKRPSASTEKRTAAFVSPSRPVSEAPVQTDAQARSEPSGSQSAAAGAPVMDSALLALIHRAVEESKRYPRRARRRGMEGRAVVRFELSPDGAVSGLEIREASGHGLLDRAAADAVRAIAPLAGAERYLARTRTLELGVEFRLR